MVSYKKMVHARLSNERYGRFCREEEQCDFELMRARKDRMVKYATRDLLPPYDVVVWDKETDQLRTWPIRDDDAPQFLGPI